MTEYMRKRKIRLDEKKVKDSSLFGLMLGTILILVGFLRWLTTYSILSYLWIALNVIGIFLFITSILIPQCIVWLYNVLRYVGNKIGSIVFAILLFAVYYILVVPIGFFIEDRRSKYAYIMWDNEYAGKEMSYFSPWKETNRTEIKGIRGITIKLIQYLVLNGKLIFIPVVLILLILGIILFFVSSSVFAPFIYTLF